MAADPVREWSFAFLLLGGIVLAFSIAFAAAEVVLASANARGYMFAGPSVTGIATGVFLLIAGGGLRVGTMRQGLRRLH